jgi:translation initiation factor RLI1
MIIKRIPVIDFNKCFPERCHRGICIAGYACPHKVFFQEKPYDFPMHNASMCIGCGSCSDACPLKAIRMV